MLGGLVLGRISQPENELAVYPSRCLRMRFSENQCNHCTSECPVSAISFDPELSLDAEKCSSCMRCTAVCPAEALTSGDMSFPAVVKKLKQAQNPVLSCKQQPQLQAHVKTDCLGWLAEEHLLGLWFLLPGELHVNLTECANCPNGFVVGKLRESLAGVSDKLNVDVTRKIRLVEDEADLKYQAMALDRRDFFTVFKTIATEKLADFTNNSLSGVERSDYGQKRLPQTRELLNRVVQQTSGEMREKISRSYFYDVEIDATCDGCSDCVAICPTEALKTGIDSKDDQIVFDPLQCNGCGLCDEFCPLSAIQVKKGDC